MKTSIKDKSILLIIVTIGLSITLFVITYSYRSKANAKKTKVLSEEQVMENEEEKIEDNMTITNTVLPTASSELKRQIEEAPKIIVKPRVVDEETQTFESYMKDKGYKLEEIEFTDIPVGNNFEYEGLELMVTEYSIMTGDGFFNKYFDEANNHNYGSDPEQYGIYKNGTYAVVNYSYHKIADDPTYFTDVILFTDMKWLEMEDPEKTMIVRNYLGKTGKGRRLMDIPIGEQIDSVFVLCFAEPSDSDEFFILIPKVSGEVEKKLMVDGKMTEDEALAKFNENKNKFYRIVLTK